MNARACCALSITALLTTAAALPAWAGVVNMLPAEIDARVVSFSDYNAVTSPSVLAPDLDVGTSETGEQVLLNSNNPDTERILGAVNQGFGANGSWPTDGAFAGLNKLSGYLSFTFSRGLNFVGGFFNYTPGGDSSTRVDALDIAGDVIEGLDLTFTGSDGQFIGFTSGNAAIYGLQMSGNYVAVDNLTFGTTRAGGDVPEPGMLLLAMTSLALLGWTCQRQRRATTGK